MAFCFSTMEPYFDVFTEEIEFVSDDTEEDSNEKKNEEKIDKDKFFLYNRLVIVKQTMLSIKSNKSSVVTTPISNFVDSVPSPPPDKIF